MPEIRAIHGLRYDLGHIGSLAEVISPPADEISPEMLDELYKRHPANVIRVLTNREEPGDDERTNRFSRAARFMTNWQRQGVVRRDPDPAIYVYHQEFEVDGAMVTRRGFLAGQVLPTLTDEESERICYVNTPEVATTADWLHAIKTNVEPILGVYVDPRQEVTRLMDEAIATQTPLVAKDVDSVIHKLWPLTEHRLIGAIREAMANRTVHHLNQEALVGAALYRHDLQQRGELFATHPANQALAMYFELSEPGLQCPVQMPLYMNAPRLTSEELITKLQPYFDAISYGEGVEIGGQLESELKELGEFGSFGLYCAADDRWVIASLTEEGMLRMDEIASDRPEAWRYLDSSILERLIVTELLEKAEPQATFCESTAALIEAVQVDEGNTITLAAIVLPAQPSQLTPLWESGQAMDAEIVIDPQPPCGLVFNPLA